MRKTLHLDAKDAADLQQAAKLLRQGGLVAFPTETVYGLGANALSSRAVEGVFQAKGRPAWDPLIVHLAHLDQLPAIAAVDEGTADRVGQLARAFWPGPLTMLLPRVAAVPDAVTAGRALVGCRIPAHPAALALLQAAQVPVAAPSANRFGHTSPTTAQHVLDDLDGRIDAVLDGGPCALGVESTVLDPVSLPMVVYRAGAVTLQQLSEATRCPVQPFAEQAALVSSDRPGALPSPGVGLRHYAPEAALQLTDGTPEALSHAVHAAVRSGAHVGVMLPSPWTLQDTGTVSHPWGRWDDDDSLASALFAGLRSLEQKGVAVIVCPMPAPGGVRDAIRDRLMKAAKPR